MPDPPDTLKEHLPDPPDTLEEHLPDPPDTLEEYLPDPPDTLEEHLPDPPDTLEEMLLDTIPPEILLDTIPPDILPDILLDPIPPDILPDAQAGSIDPALPRGEKRGNDPGGQQPEVIGTLCGRGLKDSSCSRIRISDRRRYRSYRGRFRPSSEDQRRSYRSNRDRFKKSINYKTLVMGPVSPMKTETGQRTFVPVFYPVRMKREDNPNKWET